MRNRALILLSVLTLIACKKTIQQTPVQADPLFTVAYTVNGNYRTIQAGKEDYYMYSSSESDEFNVSQLIGEIKGINSSKANAFEFKFRSNSETNINLDSVLTIGKKELTDSNLLQASTTKFLVSLNAFKTDHVDTYLWSVNSGLSSTLKSPSFVFDSKDDPNFPASLQTFFDTGCTALTKRCINFNNMGCWGDFNVEQGPDLEYTFSVPPQQNDEVEKVHWYVGINYEPSNLKNQLVHKFQSPGQYLISADVYFKSGCVSCLSKEIIVEPAYTNGGCLSDFDVNYSPFNEVAHLQLNTIEINYWDESGVLFSSVYCASPGSLEILEISDFENNEVGNQTKKVRLSGEVKLTSAQGSEITIDIEESTIAVGTRQ